MRGLACAVGLWLAGNLALVAAIAAPAAIPPAPQYFVVDEPGVLQARTLQTLNRLFVAQEQATTQQIVFAIFSSLQGEDVVARTNQIFQAWKIGKKGKDNGVLLALYWKDHQSRIEVGYGLEPLLTDFHSKRILAEILRPQLQSSNPDIGLLAAAREILTVLKSPLIENGQAEAILRGAGYMRRSVSSENGNGTSFLQFLIFGLFFVVYIIIKMFSGPRWPRGGGWGGGGGWGDGGGWGGGSGGDGGFSGGGGSSGGGGASDRW